MLQTKKFVDFFVRRKIVAERGIHPSADSGTLFIGQPVHATPTRFDFTRYGGKLFLVLFRPGLNLL
jgi:hypothetical protein